MGCHVREGRPRGAFVPASLRSRLAASYESASKLLVLAAFVFELARPLSFSELFA